MEHRLTTYQTICNRGAKPQSSEGKCAVYIQPSDTENKRDRKYSKIPYYIFSSLADMPEAYFQHIITDQS